MKKPTFKKGQRVSDRWYIEWGIGRIISVLKTRMKVRFVDGTVLAYDKAHYQFLQAER